MSFLNLNFYWFVFACVVMGGAWVLLVFAAKRRRAVCRRILGEGLAARGQASVAFGLRALRSLLFMSALLLALFALARPWWGKRLIPYPSRSRDILIAFDCSRSMLADDVAPSRLEHGKWLIRQLAEQFTGDRFGLVAFAGDAFLECPLTQDRSSLFLFLDELDTGTIPVGGTNISRALEVVKDAFDGAEGLDRAVLLISDGDELQGNALQLTESLREKQIPLYVIGLGSPSQGALIRDTDGSYVRDAEGELVSTRLDEAKLKQLAVQTNGIYVRSSTTSPNLGAVAGKIRQLVPEEAEEQVKKREIERYQIPLALSMLAFLLYFSIGERKRLPAKAVVVLAFLASLPLVAWDDAVEPPPQVAVLEKVLETAEGEEKARVYQNLGVEYQNIGDLDQAEDAYRQALIFADEQGAAGAAAAWNLGVVRHEKARRDMLKNPDTALEQLKLAEDNYRDAMRRVANASDVGRNQELLIQDEEFARKVKEQFEQVSQMQKDAAEKAKQAADAQEQASQTANPQEQRQKQQEADSKTREAAAAVDKLLQELNRMRQDSGRQELPADQAAKAIEKARQLQKEAEKSTATETADEKRGQAAEELKRASELLGGGKKPEDDSEASENQQKTGDDQQGSEGEQQEPDGAQQQGDQQPMNGEETGEAQMVQGDGEAQEDNTFDEKQAEAVLVDMQRREKDLRETLKQMRTNNAKSRPVDKNW